MASFLEDEERLQRLSTLATAQGLGDLEDKALVRFADVPGICRTCQHAQIMVRGSVEHTETRVHCHNLNEDVAPDIMQCSSYWKRGQLSLREMGELAEVVDPREGINAKAYK